jgi:hypothetical protein
VEIVTTQKSSLDGLVSFHVVGAAQ